MWPSWHPLRLLASHASDTSRVSPYEPTVIQPIVWQCSDYVEYASYGLQLDNEELTRVASRVFEWTGARSKLQIFVEAYIGHIEELPSLRPDGRAV